MDFLYKLQVEDYAGQTLTNASVYTKLDGVCCIYDGNEWRSTAFNKLFNLPSGMERGIYECFLGSWNKSISAVKTQSNSPPIHPNCLFRIGPDKVDNRLFVGNFTFLTKLIADKLLQDAVDHGHEGIIIHCWYMGRRRIFKHKKQRTLDVLVLQSLSGKGKHAGRMGALMTTHGKVGTGFSDEEREQFTPEFIVGKMIEVSCAQINESGVMSQAKFIRLREDKTKL